MTPTMVPDPSVRPAVLPTDRLQANGMCVAELRPALRRIDDRRNALSVLALWLSVVAVVGVAVWVDNPFLYVLAFVAMGPLYVRFAILMHEAAHKLLFTDKRLNDWVGTWLIAYPAFVPIGLYRRGHFAHHRAEFGPDDPDLGYYGGYPCDRAALRRRLCRDAVGISGWKNLVPLVKAVRPRRSRRLALSILGVQALMWAAAWLATGRWWIYPLLWWLPWMTEWRVLNRLRSIAEHGGLQAGNDRRVTTHNVRQTWPARLWLVPYNTGWHLAHHVDMGIPWRNLPRFHAELVRAGYVTEGLTYRSYRALWRALASA
ncbi:MAG TPA: fatty acid desaturase [Acidimicrobiales bacterium]|nr:fatty acid desaturase [Acidimicrobiales bacterium]